MSVFRPMFGNSRLAHRMRRLASAVLAACVFLLWPPGALADTSVAVLYPDIREPYRAVFLEIIEGLEAALGAPVPRLAVDDPLDRQALRSWLNDTSPDVVVALGSRGLHAAKAVSSSSTRIVAGAVMAEPGEGLNGYSGITLTPDPRVLFDRLKELAPMVRKVSVIYSPEQNGWLMDIAKEAARARGLTLKAIPANGLREAAATYRRILRQAGPADAVWLPQDPSTVDEQAILSSILKDAWEKNVVVFSSNPAHARRGTLFSLFPDNSGLGRSLAELVRREQRGSRQPSVTPLHDLLIAVNVRTAEHLGLSFSARELREFDIVFPSP